MINDLRAQIINFLRNVFTHQIFRFFGSYTFVATLDLNYLAHAQLNVDIMLTRHTGKTLKEVFLCESYLLIRCAGFQVNVSKMIFQSLFVKVILSFIMLLFLAACHGYLECSMPTEN
jgi:hypothetical protein